MREKTWKAALRTAAGTVLVLGCLGSLAFAGYLVGRHQLPTYGLFSTIETRARAMVRAARDASSFKEDQAVSWEMESIFLRLSAQGVRVPARREGSGGGLTSLGEEVLVLTHDGRIFSARPGGPVRETQIAAPENGFDAYQEAAASDRFRDMIHALHHFRYNDILHFSSGESQGLAISYTEFDAANACYGTAVAILPLAPGVKSAAQIRAGKDAWNVIFRTRPCLPLKKEWRALEGHMAGGRMAFSAPTTLYLGSGDYHWDGIYAPKALAQRTDNDYGKVLAIDIATRQSSQVSIGNRNIQGIALDSAQQLWVVEHGLRGGDELNRVRSGANFGWPLETLGTLYNKTPVPGTRSYGRHDAFVAPTFAWLPSIATSALTLVQGFHESWDGDLLVGTLRDQALHRVRIKDGRALFAERIPFGKRIRSVLQHTDGQLVLWTDDRYLVFMTIAKQSFVGRFVDQHIAGRGYDDRQLRRVRAALDSCMQCHSLEPGDHRSAPSLAGVFGSAVATTSYSGYSTALKTRGGRWSAEALQAYLLHPDAYAPGTVMPATSDLDQWTTTEIVALLEALSLAAE
jgi:cytochrome c2